jgi:hypothetical protein
MFCEADAAAQGIFTGELRLTEGRYFQLKSPRAQRPRPLGALTTDMPPSFPIIFLTAPHHASLSAFRHSWRCPARRPSRISLMYVLVPRSHLSVCASFG